MRIVKPDLKIIQEAAELLRQNRLVGVPTETVYGLAGDATNDLAVARIYEAKGRPEFNPLIVHVTSSNEAKEYAQFNALAEQLAATFWPGPLTLVLPLQKDSKISKLVTAGLPTVAMRCPRNEIALNLIREAGRPLAAPSANPSTRISPTLAIHVYEGFKEKSEPTLILDGGKCGIGLESTVLDLTDKKPTLLRLGGLDLTTLSNFCDIVEAKSGSQIKSPGMMLKHYAPKHCLRMNADEVREEEILLAFGPNPLKGGKKTFNLSPSGDLTEAATNLFSMLHEIDQNECQGIAVMPIPEEDLGMAINDRLRRAS